MTGSLTGRLRGSLTSPLTGSLAGMLSGGLTGRLMAVATAVELLEESGLPPLCVAIAMEEDAARPLGHVLAQAVQVRLRFLGVQGTALNPWTS